MKQAFKKPLALILALVLLLALPMQALGAEHVRETDYFPEKYHTELPYSDLVFAQPDLEGAEAVVASIEPLLDDPANTAYIGRLFEELDGLLKHGVTMVYLSNLDRMKDPTDEEVAARYLTASERASQMVVKINQLVAKMAGSPGREALLDFMTEMAIQETVESAAADSPEEQELLQKITELKSRYLLLMSQEDSEERRQAVGELYLELVKANNRLAQLKGYGNYQDYAYQEFYHRDYTPEDTARLRLDIKKYVAPYGMAYLLANEVSMYGESSMEQFDALSPEIQEKLQKFLGGISSELLESYHFMWDKGYYDYEETGPGDQSAFVTYLYEQEAPFMRINHGGFETANANAVWKLRTFIHEFGHYNANYHLPQNIWQNASSNMDVQETHSTGLEALFASDLEEIVGEENADMVLLEYLRNKFTSTLLYQTALDELEEYAYTTPGVTVEDLNRKYVRLRKEYGYLKESDQNTDWMTISHLFDSPFYVISYTTSGLATACLWLDSLDDREGAIDKYLTFVSQGMDATLRDALSKSGMADPFQEGMVKTIVDGANREFNIKDRLTEVAGHPFTDVILDTNAWYRDAVKYVYQQGIMVGTGDMEFSPNATFDRGMLVTTLWRQAGSPGMEDEIWGYPYEDVDMDAYYGTAVYWARLEGIASGVGGNRFAPSVPVTRQDFVTMLWRQAGKPKGNLSALERFHDQGQISGYAREAMAWAVGNLIVSGRGNGILAPKGSTTRAEAAQIFMNAGKMYSEAAVIDDAA